MRFFTLFIATIAITFSVSANDTETQKLSPDFRVCSKSIKMGTDSIARLKEATNRATSTANSFREKVPYILALTLGGSLSSAHKNCCTRFAPTMNDEDLNAILPFLSSFTDEYDDLLTAVVSKNSIVKNNALNMRTVKYIVENGKSGMDIFLNCVATHGTPDEAALFDKLNKAYSNAKAVYTF